MVALAGRVSTYFFSKLFSAGNCQKTRQSWDVETNCSARNSQKICSKRELPKRTSPLKSKISMAGQLFLKNHSFLEENWFHHIFFSVKKLFALKNLQNFENLIEELSGTIYTF